MTTDHNCLPIIEKWTNEAVIQSEEGDLIAHVLRNALGVMKIMAKDGLSKADKKLLFSIRSLDQSISDAMELDPRINRHRKLVYGVCDAFGGTVRKFMAKSADSLQNERFINVKQEYVSLDEVETHSNAPAISDNTSSSALTVPYSLGLADQYIFHDDPFKIEQQPFLNESSIVETTPFVLEVPMNEFIAIQRAVAVAESREGDHSVPVPSPFPLSSLPYPYQEEDTVTSSVRTVSITTNAYAPSSAASVPTASPLPRQNAIIEDMRTRLGIPKFVINPPPLGIDSPNPLGPFDCDKCREKFESSEPLLLHMARHEARSRICCVCSVRLDDDVALTVHMKDSHPFLPIGNPDQQKRPYRCLQCPRVTFSQESFDLHMWRMHQTEPAAAAPAAPTAAAAPAASAPRTQKRHHSGIDGNQIRRVSDGARVWPPQSGITCKECALSYTSIPEYVQHMDRNHIEPERAAAEAAVAVNSSSSQRTTEPAESETINDGTTASSTQGTFNKPRIRKAKYEYCEICNWKFTTKGFLKCHLRNKHGIKPYKCDLCHKNFPWHAILAAHRANCQGQEDV